MQLSFLDYAKIFLAGFVSIVALDSFWLGIVTKTIFLNFAGPILREPVVIWSVVIVWILVVVGNIIFVLPKTVDVQWLEIFKIGALYGLILYGVYDFTNYAILTHWPLGLVIFDATWGIVLNGIIALILAWSYRLIK